MPPGRAGRGRGPRRRGCFLTLGIALGSWWAYYELGWGGWWFWDPVENASFMPWLVGTALIHSLAVTEKRGAFKKLDRAAGHRRVFAEPAGDLPGALRRADLGACLRHRPQARHFHPRLPRRGDRRFAGAVCLARAQGRPGRASFALVSRESMLLSNNVLLLVAAGAVLLGTLYPLFIDALGLGKLSVGPPYFEAVFVPLMAPALFLMGVGPLARWKQASVPATWCGCAWALAVSVAVGIAVPLCMGRWTPLVALGLLLASGSSALHPCCARQDGGSVAGWRQPRILRHAARAPRRGGIRHRRDPGQKATRPRATCAWSRAIPSHRRLHVPADRRRGSDGTELPAPRVGDVGDHRDGKLVTTMHPEKRIYTCRTCR